MTEDEFFSMIEEKYGEEWTPDDIKQDKEIYSEYLKRVSTGV